MLRKCRVYATNAAIGAASIGCTLFPPAYNLDLHALSLKCATTYMYDVPVRDKGNIQMRMSNIRKLTINTNVFVYMYIYRQVRGRKMGSYYLHTGA